MLSPQDVAKEVARLIAQDQLCYIDRKSRKITAFPADELDKTNIAQQITTFEDHIDKYVKIGPMPTKSLLLGMEYFLDEVTDKNVAKELARGLKRENPVRNFLQAVEGDMEVYQHWRRYKKEHYQWYVEQLMIAAYNH